MQPISTADACDMADEHATRTADEHATKTSSKEEADENASSQALFQTLTAGVRGSDGMLVEGMLRRRTRKHAGTRGRLNFPFRPQRRAARRAMKFLRYVIAHDAGMGKTLTFLMVYCCMHIINNGNKQKMLISAPTSCLYQWHNAVLDALRIKDAEIFNTNQVHAITRRTIKDHRVLIVSKDLISRAYGECFEYVSKHSQNEAGKWVGCWVRRPNTDLHPIFTSKFDLVGVDEVHNMRNSRTLSTKGHELISSNADKVIGLSATPLFNNPRDLAGIATALDMNSSVDEPSLKNEASYFTDKSRTKVNLKQLLAFSEKMDRAHDSILNLPEITEVDVSFDAEMDLKEVDGYNTLLMQAKRIRATMQIKQSVTNNELQKLTSYLNTMQQYIVSPLLAQQTAKVVSGDPELIAQCSRQATGLMRALAAQIESLQSEGFVNVLVAACHTTMMAVAKQYVEREKPACGESFMYHGGLTLKRRAEMVASFLNSKKSTMFMSIDAGGTGLHLVPGCNAIIFCLSRPYSPMQILQTKKRIHRIGQTKPVKVVHLVAEGSVDDALRSLHRDKTDLAKALMDNDDALVAKDGKWRTHGRIVDSCRWLDPKTGNFTNEAVQEQEIIDEINRKLSVPVHVHTVAVPADRTITNVQVARPYVPHPNPMALAVPSGKFADNARLAAMFMHMSSCAPQPMVQASSCAPQHMVQAYSCAPQPMMQAYSYAPPPMFPILTRGSVPTFGVNVPNSLTVANVVRKQD